MKPAILFGGDVTCYVLWAVTRDGTVENMGELWVRDASETRRVFDRFEIVRDDGDR